MPYISVCYLIKRSVVVDEKTRPAFISGLLDPDMAFCENMRNAVREHAEHRTAGSGGGSGGDGSGPGSDVMAAGGTV